MAANLHVYSTDFKPIALIGHTLTIKKSDSPGGLGVRIEAIDALPSYTHDFGDLSASSLAQNVNQIQQGEGEFAQFRMIIRDAFEIELTHPNTVTRRWRARTQNFRLVPWINDLTLYRGLQDFYFAASELFIFEDETPRFDLYPQASASDIRGHIEFIGWKFKYSTLGAGRKGAFPIWMNSWPGGGSAAI